MFFVLAATAAAQDLAWRCDPLVTPADAFPYRWEVDYSARNAGAAAEDEALAWVDETCFTDCGGKSRWEGCTDAACTTAAGAWVEYHQEWELDAYKNVTTTTTVSVIPPSSETWTHLAVTFVESDLGLGSCYGGSRSWDVAWTGVLDPAWPTDGAFAAAWMTVEGPSCNEREQSWADASCAWSVQRSGHSPMVHYVTTDPAASDAVTVRVMTEGGTQCGLDGEWAWMDDVYVGRVDPDTWALVGTDEDGDGWSVEDGDCDDDAAAVFPCAVDPDSDGVDGDCDGVGGAPEDTAADDTGADDTASGDTGTGTTDDTDDIGDADTAPPPFDDRDDPPADTPPSGGCRGASASLFALALLLRTHRPRPSP